MLSISLWEFVMDPFFLPLPVVYPPAPDVYHSTVVQQLERYLDIALCLLRKTTEQLQAALGPKALDPEWPRFLAGHAHRALV